MKQDDPTTKPLAPGSVGVEASDGLATTNCLFEQPWWLDAVSPGNWAEATVRKDGEVIARLPYSLRSRYGLRMAGNPPFTPTLGPWLRYTSTKYAYRLAEEQTLLTELIDQLPHCDLFQQTFVPTGTNILPFHWRGYERRTSVTYRLDQLQDHDVLWDNLDKRCRTAIRKGQKLLTVRTDLSLETFLDVADKTFRRQDLTSPLARGLVGRLDAACAARGARQMFFAEDAQGRIHAAMYLVWDSRAAYYLMGGADPELRSSGAQNLLMWEALQFASKVTRIFDFEGSSVQAIEQFVRSFGAQQVVLPRVFKQSRRFSALTGAKMVAEALSGRKIKWFV